MESLIPYLVGGALTIVGSGGAAWAGVRASLNGQKEMARVTRDGVQRLEDKVDRIVVDHGTRIARLEVWAE